MEVDIREFSPQMRVEKDNGSNSEDTEVVLVCERAI